MFLDSFKRVFILYAMSNLICYVLLLLFFVVVVVVSHFPLSDRCTVFDLNS